jgi:hypothetical protein
MGQAPVINGDFEQGEPGAVPAGWIVPKTLADAGFTAKTVEQGCRTGARCAVISGPENPPPNLYGNLVQSLPAAGYTPRRLRLRAAIRVEGQGTRAQMWLKLDRADNSIAFQENMGARPITSSEWQTYDIQAVAGRETARIGFGVAVHGPGKAWVDDVTLEAIGEVREEPPEPPRPLSPRGLVNVTAFTKLYGYVRFFHPSDQVAETDWETFAIEGARKVEGAGTDEQLAARLMELFRPIAPAVAVFASAERPAAAPPVKTARVARYRHSGVGLAPLSGRAQYSLYSSTIVKTEAAAVEPFEAEIAPGVKAMVPLTLPVDENGRTLPAAPIPAKPPEFSRTAEDRATRIGAVIIAWNVFQHFYPYFDVVKTDWPGELVRAVRSAATDSSAAAFNKTLQRLVAALKDGHGSVTSPDQRAILVAPLVLAWAEGQWLVTRSGGAKAAGVLPGDRVVSIDGRPVEQLEAERRELTSAATEGWMRWRIAGSLRSCRPEKGVISLELETYAAPRTARKVELACEAPKYKDMESYPEPRPEKLAELGAGILYVDLDRVDETDWKSVVERAGKAKAIVFDMRGYPGQPGLLALRHLTRETIRCARWNIPAAARPDRLEFPFNESGWDVRPAEPYFDIPRVFLTDGRAISYAETVMGIVEHYRLGDIAGEPTAGTNGNVNPFRLPGGYSVSWTGMKVLKHDRSQHHGIGILPTVPVSRTRAGVAAGRDEVLDRAVEFLKSRLK